MLLLMKMCINRKERNNLLPHKGDLKDMDLNNLYPLDIRKREKLDNEARSLT